MRVPGSVPKMWIHFGPLWIWFSRIPGEDPHIVCRQVIPYVFSIVSTWLLQFVPSKVSTFSRIMHKIHLNCPHVIPNPFLIISHFFPHSTIIPQTLHRAQGHWRAAPRSAAARAETLQAIGAGTGGTSFCAGGTEGRAEWEDGDEIMGKMEGVIKQRTKMGISCRLYPILPNVKFPPWTPWF